MVARKLIFVGLTIVLLVLVVPWLLPRPGLDGTIPELPFADSRFAQVEGIRMHWRERQPEPDNNRPLIVLLHGFGGSSFSWRHTLESLEREGHPVIAPDVPPFGYSERTAGGPGWPELVIGVVDHVRPGVDMVLVGHSMGAGVAANIASRVPERVRQIIMVDGTPGLRRPPGRMSWVMQVPSFARAAEVFAAWQLVDQEAISEMLASAFGRPATDEELQGYFRPLTVPGTYPALLRRMAQRGTPGQAWSDVPTALIWGENDEWVPRARADALVDTYPKIAPIRTIEGAAHNPMDTHPEALDRLLLELLRD